MYFKYEEAIGDWNAETETWLSVLSTEKGKYVCKRMFHSVSPTRGCVGVGGVEFRVLKARAGAFSRGRLHIIGHIEEDCY